MWRYAFAAIRIVVGCVDVIALYVGVFLKEDQEGKIQDATHGSEGGKFERRSLESGESGSFTAPVRPAATWRRPTAVWTTNTLSEN